MKKDIVVNFTTFYIRLLKYKKEKKRLHERKMNLRKYLCRRKNKNQSERIKILLRKTTHNVFSIQITEC